MLLYNHILENGIIMKFIMFDTDKPLLVIFNKHIVHRDLYDTFVNTTDLYENTFSAGFANTRNKILSLHGESESLGVKARQSDNTHNFNTLNYIVIDSQWKLDFGDDKFYSFIFLFSTEMSHEDFFNIIKYHRIGSTYKWTRLTALPYLIKYQGIVENINGFYKCDEKEVNDLLINAI